MHRVGIAGHGLRQCLVLEVLALALPHARRLRPRQLCLRLQLLLLQHPIKKFSSMPLETSLLRLMPCLLRDMRVQLAPGADEQDHRLCRLSCARQAIKHAYEARCAHDAH